MADDESGVNPYLLPPIYCDRIKIEGGEVLLMRHAPLEPKATGESGDGDHTSSHFANKDQHLGK